MKLTFETTQQYTGLPETTISVPLNSEGATAEVKITRLLNLEMKTDILFYMGKLLEVFAAELDEDLEDAEAFAEEFTGHALTLALLHVATDIEFPPITEVDNMLTMYRWLIETNIIEAILAELPPGTAQDILEFVNVTIGDIEKKGVGDETKQTNSGGISPIN